MALVWHNTRQKVAQLNSEFLSRRFSLEMNNFKKKRIFANLQISFYTFLSKALYSAQIGSKATMKRGPLVHFGKASAEKNQTTSMAVKFSGVIKLMEAL